MVMRENKKSGPGRKGRTPNRLLTDAFREIKNTRSRFLSLLVLSALAVCFLAGLRATAPDMKISADRYFDAQKLMDLRVVSTLGLGQDDVDALAQAEGVQEAEGAYTVDAYFRTPEKDHIVKVHSLSDRINLPHLLEGRMPTAPNEILTEAAFLKDAGLNIGDTVVMETGEGTFEDALIPREFTIVGTADTPLYIATERGSSSLGTGRVAAYVLALPEAFHMEYYTDAFLTMEGTEELRTYSDEYDAKMDDFIDRLQPLADERAPLRRETLLAQANEELTQHQQELDEAKADAEQQLNDAWAKLEEAKQQLADGQAQYQDGLNQYNDGVQQYQDGLKQYQDGCAELDVQLAAAQAQMAEGEAQLNEAKKQLEAGQPALDAARAKLDEGWTEYNTNYDRYADGVKQYEDGLNQVQEGRAQLEQAKKQLEAGKTALDAGEKQFHQLLDVVCQLVQPDLTPEKLLDTLRAEQKLPAGQRPLTQKVDDLLNTTQSVGNQVITELRQQLEALKNNQQELMTKLNEAKAQFEAKLNEPGLTEQERAAYEYGIQICDRLLKELNEPSPALEHLYEQILKELKQAEEQLTQLPNSSAAILATADQLDAGRQELEKGWAQYHAGMAQLDEAEQVLTDSKGQLDEAKKQLDSGHAALLDGEKQYQAGAQQAADGWAQYHQGMADLEAGKQQLNEEAAKGRTQLNEAKAALEDAKKQLDESKVQLADAKAELDAGEQQYQDGLKEYQKGKEEAALQIRDAQDQLDQARRDMENIEECQWYLLDRNTNMGYVSYSMDADRMGNLANVFPLIFFLVAALVCLTTMTRMVEEQRIAIGGLKALGYSKGAIAIKYVGYGFLASTMGALIGLAVGLTLVPGIICTAWHIMYKTGPIYFSTEPVTSTVACLAAIGTVTLSALVACFKTLTAVPAQLMRPKAPPMGKRILLERITPLWRRLSFNHKITLRNLFRYKRRFWMTVVGIGGCAALIVTAFGLRDSLLSITEKQYHELYTYTDQIGLVEKVTDGELREVEELLNSNDLVAAWSSCRSEQATAETDAYSVDVKLDVLKDHETLSRYVNLRHRTNNKPVTLPDDGALITEKAAILLDVKPGDTFTLDNGDRRVEIKVADVIENYIQHFVYISDAYYETLFGEAPAPNMVFIDCPGDEANAQKLATDLMALDGVTSLSRMSDTRKVFGSSLASVDYAVLLIIVCAAALAFVVLYNLTNINITERMRELATLKVLGFYDGELSAYVYRENVILTVFGVALGMLLGKLLHYWLILTVEIDMFMFGRTLQLASYGWAIVLTILFSLLVNLAAHWKLKKLDMVESLKSVE